MKKHTLTVPESEDTNTATDLALNADETELVRR
jgi:hypothetical protein